MTVSALRTRGEQYQNTSESFCKNTITVYREIFALFYPPFAFVVIGQFVTGRIHNNYE